MPSNAPRTPSYRLHKPSGQAVVTLSGNDHYLGPHDAQASLNEYDRLIAEWLAGGRQLGGNGPDLVVTELIKRYWEYAKSYYRKPDGADSGEAHHIKLAVRPLKRLYGNTPASGFGPLALKAVRDEMVRSGWSRKYANNQTNRIKRMFRWAVGNELLPPSAYHRLQALEPLKAGRSDARETDPVGPVPDALVDAVLPMVSRQVRAMIELQRLTGMRPGEVFIMRGADICFAGGAGTWKYTPSSHKTQHRNHQRKVPLGPRAQAVLRPFLKPEPLAYLFSPAEAESERRAAAHAARKTPPSYGNIPGSNRMAKPRRRPADRYNVFSYRRAIVRACDRAFPVPQGVAAEEAKQWRRRHRFHPHQLRHTAATRLRQEFGLEVAQVILGHKTVSATQIYAEKNVEKATQVMAQVG